MKRDTVNYFAVGVFVLGMFALLLVTLFAITGKGGDTHSYFVRYANIAGITKGSTVTVNGFKVGRVMRITPVTSQDSSGYQLELSIHKDWRIPVDSTARILIPGLLAAKQVDIKPGVSAEYIPPGGTIIGTKETNLMAAMQNVAAEISDLSEKTIKPLVMKLSSTVENLGNDLSGNIPHITENTNTLLTSLNQTANRLNSILNEKNESHVNDFLANANTFSEELSTISTDIGSLKNELQLFLKDSHQLIHENKNDLHKSIVGLADSSELLNNHLNTILYHLDGTSRNLHELSRSIRENPGLLIRGTKTEDPMEGGKR